MELGHEIIEKENILKNIFNRLKERNFKGNTGQAIKNSSFQLTQNIVSKVGSLLFTIVLARILMPERMGLYSLALSTIVLIASFSDLGIGNAILTYVSKELGRGNSERAKGYLKKLLSWKKYLLVFTSLILLGASWFIAKDYYHKPIFYALIVGAIYIPINGLLGFLETTFKASNNFKFPLRKEFIFQISRFTLVPVGILILLKLNLSNSIIVMGVILISSFAYAIGLVYLKVKSKKQLPFLEGYAHKLSTYEKKGLEKFILPLSAMALSGVFFGYVDIIMLGHYISGEFISYYQAAFSLIASAAAILNFTAIALFPLFSKLEGNNLEKLFKKSRNFTALISFFAGAVTYFFGYWIVRIAYGAAYLQAVPVLKLFAILIIFSPVGALYSNYFVSQKKTKVLMWLLIGATVLNITLNFIGINYGLKVGGAMGAIIGASLATITSRVLYFVGLVVWRKKKN